MPFDLFPQSSPEHVPVDLVDFKETLADLRIKAYKKEKDSALAAQNKAQKLLEENQSLHSENRKLKAENSRLKSKIKKLQNQIGKLK